MLIWLPPSEGKNAPAVGSALSLESLSHPGLTADRRKVADALIELGAGSQAASTLKVGDRIDLSVNETLMSAPCAPASSLFTGVLFEAITAAAPDAWEGTGTEAVSVFSGLFGVLCPTDAIPDHRLAMGVSLPGFGVLSTWWAPRLDAALREEASGQVVLDARSGPYRAACKAPWARVWELRVVREAVGKRRVVSHDAKRWRGAVTGRLLASGGYAAADTVECEQQLTDAAHSVTLRDARGGEHRVTDVEFGAEKKTKDGGTTRALTLVTN